jgi:hypothetical protein
VEAHVSQCAAQRAPLNSKKPGGLAAAGLSNGCGGSQPPLLNWHLLAGLDSTAFGTHSMRRTKAAEIYKKTGNLRAVQLLLGHTKLESTARYLGVEVDDALSIAEQVEL